MGTRWTVEEVVEATGGATRARAMSLAAVCTDSRRVPADSLFFALHGEFHDGHDHVAAALARGSAAAVVERIPEGVPTDRTIVVPDALRALGDLAAFTRRRNRPRVVGITGSNGKTTTKELIASILERASFPPPQHGIGKTEGNLNNLIGLPLTILSLEGNEAVVVLEMGMNAPGEIARLTEIADPDVGVITNVGPAHLAGLGTLEGVAAAKGELFAGMRSDAVIAVNADDERVVGQAAMFPGRRVEFGRIGTVTAANARERELSGVDFDLHVGSEVAPIKLPLAGLHNVGNALAAATVAHVLGVGIEIIREGLEAAHSPKMRMQVHKLANGVTVINDGYNANPASTEAALLTLARQPGRRIAVIGEMRELGAASVGEHRRIGRVVAEAGIEMLITMGPEADVCAASAIDAGMDAAHVSVCADPPAVAAVVRSIEATGDVILLKGSRGPDGEEWVRKHGSRMAAVMHELAASGGRS